MDSGITPEKQEEYAKKARELFGMKEFDDCTDETRKFLEKKLGGKQDVYSLPSKGR